MIYVHVNERVCTPLNNKDMGLVKGPDPVSLTAGSSSVRFPRPNWPYPNYSLNLGFLTSFPL